MSNKVVTVGIWNGAPFGNAIISGIERLNTFLESEDLAVHYEPVMVDSRHLPQIDKLPDIMFFDGGEDINPIRYKQKNSYSSFNDARDAAEFKLVDYFSTYGRRLSGVCRGHQLLNVFFGGTLIQDIKHSGHFSKEALSYHKGGHKVRLKRSSPVLYNSGGKIKGRKKGHIISRFVGENPFTVSSMHHQAVRALGERLGVSLSFGNNNREARYIVEGIESSSGKIRGLQSHPEFNGYPKDGAMFSYLLHVDVFVGNLFDPDIEEIKKRLEAEGPIKRQHLPFDMQSARPVRRRETVAPRHRVRDVNTPQQIPEENTLVPGFVFQTADTTNVTWGNNDGTTTG